MCFGAMQSLLWRRELRDRPAEEERGPALQRQESARQAGLSLRSRSEGSSFLCRLQSKFQVLVKQFTSETEKQKGVTLPTEQANRDRISTPFGSGSFKERFRKSRDSNLTADKLCLGH